MKRNKKTTVSTQRTVKRIAAQSIVATNEQSKIALSQIKEAADKMDANKNARQAEFARLYLTKKLSCERSQCYISRDVYAKICQFLPVVAPSLSITNYIDSVLRHHLNDNKELINDLYQQNLKIPF